MLCLPQDPDWDGGNYTDVKNYASGNIYGTVFKDGEGRHDLLFGKIVETQDVPCVVCLVRKQSVLMIPGKSHCYDGWTFEYSGYLMGGAYNQKSATDFYCIDKDPENRRGHDTTGKQLHFVEADCGALQCPPYVNYREFQCIVCTK